MTEHLTCTQLPTIERLYYKFEVEYSFKKIKTTLWRQAVIYSAKKNIKTILKDTSKYLN